MNKFLGDTVARTIVKLIVVSVLVGMVMNVFDIYPMDIVHAFRDFAQNLWYRGWAALGRFGDWLALGAMVVIPAFVVLRLLNYRRGT